MSKTLAKEDMLVPSDLSASLAAELALNLHPPKEIFARHGFSETQAKHLVMNPVFQKMLAEAKAAWGSASNTEGRIRKKASVALEEMMPHMFAMGINPDTGAAGRNEVFKSFKSLSGMDKQEQVSGGSGFQLTINIGDTPKEIVVEGTADEV